MSTNEIYSKIEEEYDKVSFGFQNSYDTVAEFSDEIKGFVNSVKQNFKDEQDLTILNIGGTPSECEYFIENGFKVTNIDISKKMLDNIKLQNLEVNLIHSNLANYITHKKYCGIWASRSLIHIPVVDLFDVLCKVNFMLDAKGIFASLFFTTQADNNEDILEKELKYVDSTGMEMLSYRVDYSVEKLSNIIDSAGFVITKTVEVKDQDEEPAVYFEAVQDDLSD